MVVGVVTTVLVLGLLGYGMYAIYNDKPFLLPLMSGIILCVIHFGKHCSDIDNQSLINRRNEIMMNRNDYSEHHYHNLVMMYNQDLMLRRDKNKHWFLGQYISDNIDNISKL